MSASTGDAVGLVAGFASVVARAQQIFHLLAVIDVFDASVPANNLAGWSYARRTPGPHPSPTAVKALDPVFDIDVGSTLEAFEQRFHGGFHIVGMNRLKPAQVACLLLA